MKRSTWEIEVLTPLHIGTGSTLTTFDYVYDERQRVLRVIDIEKLLAQPRVSPEDLARYYKRRGFQVGQYLRDRGIPPESVERYHLTCLSDPGINPIRTFVKTAWDKPYLPGSSLKGALRTAVLWRILREDSRAFSWALGHLKNTRNQQREVPNIERSAEALGSDPNKDLMRAVQVEDSAELPLESLRVIEVGSYLLNAQGQLMRDGRLTTWVEALPPGTRVRIQMRWDEFLFSEIARDLGFQPKQHLVDDDGLLETSWAFTEALLESEISFYRQHGLGEVANRLEAFRSGESTLFCLGWGGGWSTKTVTRAFANSIDLMALRRLYRLGRSRSRRDYYDRIFPKSRRLCESSPGVLMPLGWVRLGKEG